MAVGRAGWGVRERMAVGRAGWEGGGGDGREGEECTAYLKTTPTVTCPLKRGLARTSYVSLSFSSSARGL